MAHSRIESFSDLSDFEDFLPVAENNNNKVPNISAAKSTPRFSKIQHENFNDILSPQLAKAEVDKHFKDFTFAASDDVPELDDLSIETGRGKNANSSDARFGNRRVSSGSSNDERGSPFAHKVSDQPRHPQQPQVPVYNKNTKSPFRHEFQEKVSLFTDKDIKDKKFKSNFINYIDNDIAAELPDLTGLSSIITSEIGQKKNNKKERRHKTIVNVPMDPEDQALLAAFNSYQDRVDKLEESRRQLYEKYRELYKEMKDLREAQHNYKEVESKYLKYKSHVYVLLEEKKTKSDEFELLKEQVEQQREAIKTQETATEDLKTQLEHSEKARMDSEEGVKTKDMKINELAAKINELQEEISAKKTIASTNTPLVGNSELIQKISELVENELQSIKLKDEKYKKTIISLYKELGTHLTEEIVNEETQTISNDITSRSDTDTDNFHHIVEARSKKMGLNKPIKTNLRQQVLNCMVCPKSENTNYKATMPRAASSYANSTRKFSQWEEEPTPRPSALPEESAKFVYDKMYKELSLLKDRRTELTLEYDDLDPGYDRKKRQQTASDIQQILEEIESKADQIYSMQDVMTAKNIDVDYQEKEDDEMPRRTQWINV